MSSSESKPESSVVSFCPFPIPIFLMSRLPESSSSKLTLSEPLATSQTSPLRPRPTPAVTVQPSLSSMDLSVMWMVISLLRSSPSRQSAASSWNSRASSRSRISLSLSATFASPSNSLVMIQESNSSFSLALKSRALAQSKLTAASASIVRDWLPAPPYHSKPTSVPTLDCPSL